MAKPPAFGRGAKKSAPKKPPPFAGGPSPVVTPPAPSMGGAAPPMGGFNRGGKVKGKRGKR